MSKKSKTIPAASNTGNPNTKKPRTEGVKGKQKSAQQNKETRPEERVSDGKKTGGKAQGQVGKQTQETTPPTSASASQGKFRDRNGELIKVRVSDLVEHPKNFRVHSDDQKAVFGQLIDELGWFGAPDVFRNKKGKLQLIDGHMRKEYLIEEFGADAMIEVNVTNLTEDEALVALVTHDAIGAMAGNDTDRVTALLNKLESEDGGVGRILDELAAKVGIDSEEAPEEFPEKGSDIATEHECPGCGYCWSGATGG